MTLTTHYLCTGCPLGCRLEVDEDQQHIVEVRGFSCKRGKEYAMQEHTNPRRFVTTTIQIDGAAIDRLPVRTQQTVPKDKVRALCQAIHRVSVHAPVSQGEVILSNVLGTGVDVIATRDMPLAS